MKKTIQIMVSISVLSLCGCQMHSDFTSDSQKMPVWGNYKCVAKTPAGKEYTGWSVFRSNARKNALAICKDESKSDECLLDHCYDDEKEKAKARGSLKGKKSS